MLLTLVQYETSVAQQQLQKDGLLFRYGPGRVPCEHVTNQTSDFDGTMFLQDTGHVLFDTYGCGPERRKQLSGSIRSGRAPFREAQDKMWGSLNVPFEAGFELMRTGLRADPGLLPFYDFCTQNAIPFNVMSSGMEPILRRVLELYMGKEEVILLQTTESR